MDSRTPATLPDRSAFALARTARAGCGTALPALVLTLALAPIVTACGGAGPGPRNAVERADSAGVALIRNTGPDRPLAWRFEPVLTLGGAEDGPEAFYDIGDAGIAAAADGRLYILDTGNDRVVVFDRAGRHVRTLGGRGGGPGELEFPSMLALAPDGTVGVFDFRKSGIVRFAADGAILDEVRLPGSPSRSLVLTDRGVLGVFRANRSSPDTAAERLLHIGGPDTTELAAMPLEGMKPVDLGCVRISGMAPLLQPNLTFVAMADRILASRRPEYLIEVLDPAGRLVSTISRDRPPVPATAELAAREVGDSMRIRFGGGGGCSVPPDRVVEARGFAPVVPSIRRLIATPAGGVWVERGVGREGRIIDVFAPDGEYLGTLPAGTRLPAAFRAEDEPVVIERDELDVQRVVVYRIVRDDA